jgi:hypothetical protein
MTVARRFIAGFRDHIRPASINCIALATDIVVGKESSKCT